MTAKNRSPLYQWEQEMIDAYHDYQWRLVLDPLYEKFQDWKAGKVSHLEMMAETTLHLLQCGFRIIYGYTQSDEISLLFHPSYQTFGRKLRKLNSILAGEARAKFSILLGDIAAFDCRISQLPQIGDVVDYFRWRSEDAHRNALNGHC